MDPLFSGVFLVVCEIMPYGIRGYYPVPAPMDPEEEDPSAMIGHYETTWKAVSLIGKAQFTVHTEIFQCRFCKGAISVKEVKICKICEVKHCNNCPHIKHKKLMEIEENEARVSDEAENIEDTSSGE